MDFSEELTAKALEQLKDKYSKILYVNLSTDTYTPVLINNEEWAIIKDTPLSFTGYLNWFSDSDFIHPEDKDKFKQFIEKVEANKHIVYRRKQADNNYSRMALLVFPTVNYTEENKEVLLTVRNIDNIYNQEYEQVLEEIGTIDAQTGLYNKVAFCRDADKYKNNTIGMIFADVNGLKYVNDTLGHEAGDKLIKSFSDNLHNAFRDYKVYHLSGDEFIVLCIDKDLQSFLQRALAFHKSLWMDKVPEASIGYSIKVNGGVRDVLRVAELEMYSDKQMFYKQYPKYKR